MDSNGGYVTITKEMVDEGDRELSVITDKTRRSLGSLVDTIADMDWNKEYTPQEIADAFNIPMEVLGDMDCDKGYESFVNSNKAVLVEEE